MTEPRPDPLAGARVLLVVSGSVAAYKALELARLLGRAGASVTGLLTAGGARFVTPHALQAITGRPLAEDLWSLAEEAGRGHLGLARGSDLVIVAPASADRLARLAAGLADDLAGAALLAWEGPLLLAPAMNPSMWRHPATVANLATLRARGALLVGPEEGAMAEAESGMGRLAEPPAILAAARDALAGAAPHGPPDAALEAALDAAIGAAEGEAPAASLAGRHALVTSGPTREPLDPVRYLANRSSGRQGHAVAAALAGLGARVTLVSGPVSLAPPPGVRHVPVETAREMMAACEAALPADLAVLCAAVADWRPETSAGQKLKKGGDGAAPPLALVPNPDILATLSRHARRPALVVGFAAETERVVEHAREKLARKGCDWILANDVSGDVMGGAENEVHLVSAGGVESWPRMPKEAVAARLAVRAAARLSGAAP